MGKGGKSISNEGVGVPPKDAPSVPPTGVLENHSWLFQAIMEINKGIGVLQNETKNLSARVETQTTEINTLREKLSTVTHRIALVIGGAAVIGFIIAFVPQEAKNRLFYSLFGSPPTSAQAPQASSISSSALPSSSPAPAPQSLQK